MTGAVPPKLKLRPGSEAARIKAAREWAQISQEELAHRAGVEVQWVKRRERGKQESKAGELVAIAAACGLPVQWFYLDVPRVLAASPLPADAYGPPARGHLARALEGPPTTDEAPDRDDSPREAGPGRVGQR